MFNPSWITIKTPTQEEHDKLSGQEAQTAQSPHRRLEGEFALKEWIIPDTFLVRLLEPVKELFINTKNEIYPFLKWNLLTLKEPNAWKNIRKKEESYEHLGTIEILEGGDNIGLHLLDTFDVAERLSPMKLDDFIGGGECTEWRASVKINDLSKLKMIVNTSNLEPLRPPLSTWDEFLTVEWYKVIEQKILGNTHPSNSEINYAIITLIRVLAILSQKARSVLNIVNMCERCLEKENEEIEVLLSDLKTEQEQKEQLKIELSVLEERQQTAAAQSKMYSDWLKKAVNPIGLDDKKNQALFENYNCSIISIEKMKQEIKNQGERVAEKEEEIKDLTNNLKERQGVVQQSECVTFKAEITNFLGELSVIYTILEDFVMFNCSSSRMPDLFMLYEGGWMENTSVLDELKTFMPARNFAWFSAVKGIPLEKVSNNKLLPSYIESEIKVGLMNGEIDVKYPRPDNYDLGYSIKQLKDAGMTLELWTYRLLIDTGYDNINFSVKNKFNPFVRFFSVESWKHKLTCAGYSKTEIDAAKKKYDEFIDGGRRVVIYSVKN